MSDENTLSLSVRGEYTSVTYAEEHSMIALASLVAPCHESEDRTPIDVVAVIDYSGSMNGEKLALVKETLQFVSEHLSAEDRLSIVGFGSDVQRFQELTFMTSDSKEQTNQIIEGIHTSGYTYLSGGLVDGLEILRERSGDEAKNRIASVLLLTDGEANEGFTTTEGILKAIRLRKQRVASLENTSRDVDDSDKANASNSESDFDEDYLQQQAEEDEEEEDEEILINQVTSPFLPQQQQQQQYQQQQQQAISPLMPQMLQNNIGNMNANIFIPQQQQIASPFMFGGLDGLPDTLFDSVDDEEFLDLPASVNTFGYGSDHNSAMLKTLAEESQGIYFFVETNDQVSDAFADCLGGLLSVAAKDISLQLVGVNGCIVTKVHTRFPRRPLDGGIEVSMRDLQSEESRDLPIDILLPKLDAAHQGPFECIRVCVTFTDVDTGARETATCTLSVDRSGVETVSANDITIDRHRNRTLVAQTLQEVAQLGVNDLAAAKWKVKNVMEIILSSISSNDPLCQSLVADLKECDEGLVDRPTFASKGQHYAQNKSMSHYTQRSADSNADGGSYSTSSRMKTKKAFKMKKRK